MIPTLISDFFKAVGAFFGFIDKRSDLNNTPEMKTNAEKEKEMEQEDQDVEDIKKRDLDAVRRSAS